ncbi:uncharacterized protein LOC142349528 isoform X2 [Convolutriloba macropyga]|uniref:uncharacterized protein LOC142349528 isoform X2 n=1 Tax=Convolutriloba macropyga TaxID=536237 RepID=UPI003F5209AC
MEKLITSNSSERVQANNNAPTPKIKKRVKRRKPEEIPALEPKRVNKIETCSRLITIVSILTITLSILTFIWYLMEMYVYEIKHYLVIVNAWSDYSQTSVFIGAILILMLVILCAAFGLSLEQTWNLNYLHTVSFLSAGATVSVSAFCVFWCASQPHLLHHLEQNLMATLTTKYRGDYATDPVSVAWNWVQSSAKKCGVRGTRDWLTSNWYKSQSDPKRSYPLSCCPLYNQKTTSTLTVEKDDFKTEIMHQCYPQLGLSSALSYSAKPAEGKRGGEGKGKEDEIPTLTGSEGCSNMSGLSGAGSQSVARASRQSATSYDEETSNLDEYFQGVVDWEDRLRTIKGVYFIPPLDTRLKWKDARDYCQNHGSKDGQKSDLAVGFTSEEIDFLLDQDSYRASWRPHLGIERKKSKSRNMVTVPFGKDQVSRPVNADMNWDHWKKPALDYHHQKHFTCLDLDTTKRFECGVKPRNFFCARYWRYNGKKYDKLKARKWYFQFTDEFSLSAEYHVINKTLDFDEARNYCLTQFGDAFDLAVGFNLAEMQALTKGAKENGFLSPTELYLGSYRGSQRYVYYSVQWDIPFAAPWAPFEPEKRTKDENYGCLSSLYQARGDCKDSEEPFICAIYLKVPPEYGSRRREAKTSCLCDRRSYIFL